MLSKYGAKLFFLVGTAFFAAIFIALSYDTFKKIPAQTKTVNLTSQAIKGKHLWDKHNCMGCHALLGEGAYYAPELTKVYELKGPDTIKLMLEDPELVYPGARKMVKYKMSEEDKEAMVAFFKWIGEMDLNGFPPKPVNQ
ncbi:MAG: cytochrome c [Proteobacteria bacterium]|nr:cytochrome c [Pseudomonadota bacterium]